MILFEEFFEGRNKKEPIARVYLNSFENVEEKSRGYVLKGGRLTWLILYLSHQLSQGV